MNLYIPVHCDLEENKLHGYQQQVDKQEDRHKHAKVQNSKLSFPLQNPIQQHINTRQEHHLVIWHKLKI